MTHAEKAASAPPAGTRTGDKLPPVLDFDPSTVALAIESSASTPLLWYFYAGKISLLSRSSLYSCCMLKNCIY